MNIAHIYNILSSNNLDNFIKNDLGQIMVCPGFYMVSIKYSLA